MCWVVSSSECATTSFYFVDKEARTAWGFSVALSREKRMDRDEKCAGIIYLWFTLSLDRIRARAAHDGDNAIAIPKIGLYWQIG
ncbi:unnamed protein product [Danaus chrysippus]|uniref:(African queen) hypothetical protein n=1 Tax=Danaus chrysippus TaxID=151541 RepID=A0A8J2RC95_9NEOP|nr:unnamed protein product [Danaus chrysippus]